MNILIYIVCWVGVFAPVAIVAREVAYSIFVCNQGRSKHRRKTADKIHRSQSIIKQVTLSYARKFITTYLYEFAAYYTVYRIYLFACTGMLPTFLFISYCLEPKLNLYLWGLFAVIDFLLSIVIILMAEIGWDHRTKYDRG